MPTTTSNNTTQTARKAILPSPCVGICKIDQKTQYCIGCARTSDEITHWREGSDEWRQDIWRAVPERLFDMGVTTQRLQMTSVEILDFIEDSLRQASGTWFWGSMVVWVSTIEMFRNRFFYRVATEKL